MRKTKIVIASVLLGVSMAVIADDDDHGENHKENHGEDKWSIWKKSQSSETNPLYESECGSCHLAYPVRFLSSNVWQKIMSGLDNHFGDNAELDADVNLKITQYLTANAIDSRWSRNSNTQTLRISDSRFFRRKHHEVPSRAVGPNANCKACHPNADKGSFSEREIRIPGVRFWDD